MPTTEQVEAAVEAYLRSYNTDDRDAFLDAFHNDGVVEDPVGTPTFEGRARRAEFWDMVHGLAEKIRLTSGNITVCGNEAAMNFTIEARTGDGGMRIEAVDIFEVDDDGKITSLRAYWDITKAQPL